MINNFDWVKDIDYEKYIDGDLKTLLEIVGKEKFFELYGIFAKTSLYFTEKPLLLMKIEYIKKNVGYISTPKLARILSVSERFIYKICQKKRNTVNLNQQRLFNDNEE